MTMLHIDNLQASVTAGGTDKPILKGLSLSINPGEIHAIMGPNGAGKSTLGYTLGGRPGYEVTGGTATLNGQDLFALEPHERAAAGLFLGFQYPVEIPGVSFVQFLREAANAQRKGRGEEPLSGGEFLKLAREKAGLLKLDMDMLKRPVNVGFSGGE
jgi:Fe-S cluster assembly ATP-binding protein